MTLDRAPKKKSVSVGRMMKRKGKKGGGPDGPKNHRNAEGPPVENGKAGGAGGGKKKPVGTQEKKKDCASRGRKEVFGEKGSTPGREREKKNVSRPLPITTGLGAKKMQEQGSVAPNRGAKLVI